MSTAEKTEAQRAIERLHGILIGISVDYKLTDIEISSLFKWLNTHEYLHHVEPFQSTVLMLQRCLEDQIIDEDERDEILEWCLSFSDQLPDCMTMAVRRLHGVLHGIAIDNLITEDEILDLRDWLYDHEIFRDYWPFCDAWNIIERILEDGKISDNEKKELLEFCRQFSEHIIDDPVVYDGIYLKSWMQTNSPFFLPFTALCDRERKIQFSGSSFCFTGPARTGPRRELHEIVKSLRGIPYSNVVRRLDYLVIGAQSSPCWAYSTYGRKIELVIENRNKGDKTIILHEDDFIEQAARYR